MRAMVIPQVNNIFSGHKTRRKIEQRIVGISPMGIITHQVVLFQQLLVLPLLESANMRQLLGVSNHNNLLCSIEEWQRGGNITLARLINYHQIKNAGFKWNLAACR